MEQTKKVMKTVSLMFILTFSAKVLGQVREILIAANYGTGSASAAYQAASQIPLYLFEMSLGTAISSTFIPVFNEYWEKQGKERALDFSRNFVTVVAVLAVILVALGILFASPIMKLVAGGLTEQPETFALAVKLLKILFPMIIFAAIAYSMVGVLQSMGEFNIPASMSLVSNAVVIIYFLFFNKVWGIEGLAVTVVFGWLMQLLILLPSLKKKNVTYRFRFNLREEGLKKAAILAVPVIISACVQPINGLINIRLASGLENGAAISALSYANKLYLIIASVFTLVLTNYIFPDLSRLAVKDDKKSLVGLINQSLSIVAFILTPLSILFVLLAKPIVQLIYQYGSFTEYSTSLTATALMFYSFGMVGYGFNEVLNKTFYSLQKSKVPMRVSVIGICANILMSVILVRVMGIGGLGLSSSISAFIIAFLLNRNIRKLFGGVFNRDTVKNIIKILLSTLILGIVTFVVYQAMCRFIIGDAFILRVIRLGIPAVSGLLVYLVATFILKVDEWSSLKELIKKRGD